MTDHAIRVNGSDKKQKLNLFSSVSSITGLNKSVIAIILVGLANITGMAVGIFSQVTEFLPGVGVPSIGDVSPMFYSMNSNIDTLIINRVHLVAQQMVRAVGDGTVPIHLEVMPDFRNIPSFGHLVREGEITLPVSEADRIQWIKKTPLSEQSLTVSQTNMPVVHSGFPGSFYDITIRDITAFSMFNRSKFLAWAEPVIIKVDNNRPANADFPANAVRADIGPISGRACRMATLGIENLNPGRIVFMATGSRYGNPVNPNLQPVERTGSNNWKPAAEGVQCGRLL